MLSIEERVTLLHSVNLFVETPPEKLTHLAEILTENDLPAGEVIFEKDSPGDCMYFIIDGKVRVYDEGRTLNYLTDKDVFGEMALLDSQPRVASVATEVETRLLRLDQNVFYELLAEQPEVGRGVIRVLCQRLRARVHDMHDDYVYMQAMATVTASAVALEGGNYQPGSLDKVMERTDALGNLARVFNKMAAEVQNREQRLKQEVMELRIQIDETKKTKEVTQIVESEYFQDLQAKLKAMKNRSNSK